MHYIVPDDGPVAFAVRCLAPWAFFGLRYSGQRISTQCAVAVNYLHDGFFLFGERFGGSAFDRGCDGFSPVAFEVEVYFGQHGAVATGLPRSVVQGSSVDAQHPAVGKVEEGLRFDVHEGLSLADAAVDEFVCSGLWVVDHSVVIGDVFRPGFPGSGVFEVERAHCGFGVRLGAECRYAGESVMVVSVASSRGVAWLWSAAGASLPCLVGMGRRRRMAGLRLDVFEEVSFADAQVEGFFGGGWGGVDVVTLLLA